MIAFDWRYHAPAAMSEPIEISSSSESPPRLAPQCPLCYEPMRSCYVRVACGHAVCALCEGNLEHRRIGKCPCCNDTAANASQIFVQDARDGCEGCGAVEDVSVTTCGHLMCRDCGTRCTCVRRGDVVSRAHLNAKVAEA